MSVLAIYRRFVLCVDSVELLKLNILINFEKHLKFSELSICKFITLSNYHFIILSFYHAIIFDCIGRKSHRNGVRQEVKDWHEQRSLTCYVRDRGVQNE